MTMRPPLRQARAMGSAREGVQAWKLERLTALALAPLSLWFASFVFRAAGMGFDGYVAMASKPGNVTLLVLFVTTLFYHGMLGLIVVVEDYVHGPLARYGLLALVRFFCIGMAVFSVIAILKVALGV